jgi:1,4-dihydroxy-2-naphthoate polyprenyltransferase
MLVDSAYALVSSIRHRMNVLVIIGHSRPSTFCHALARSYVESVLKTSGVRVHCVDLAVVRFDPNLCEPSPRAQMLEPELAAAKREFLQADHIVLIFPTWWGTMPAVLKGFLDRILIPGEAFAEIGENYRGLLQNKTAHLITTMDAPGWVYRFLYQSAGIAALKHAVFQFCGFEAVRTTRFDRVKHRSEEQRRACLARIAKEAEKTAAWRRRVLARAVAFRWLRAVRLQFYPMTLVAFLVGALLTVNRNSNTSVAAFIFGYAALFLLEVASVFANEIGDRNTDLINRNFGPFTGGSRVLANEELTVSQLSAGVRYTAMAGAGFGVAAAAVSDKPFALGSLFCAALILGIGYTLSPLRLVYRTLGEMNVAFTHSFLMVFAGALSQPGPLPSRLALLVSTPLFLAVFSAITLAGIPDHDADQSADKRTIAVKFGVRTSATIAIVTALLAACMATVFIWEGVYPAVTRMVIVGVWLHCALCVRAISRRAYQCSRIDSALALALSFILWFCLPPLIALLSSNGL